MTLPVIPPDLLDSLRDEIDGVPRASAGSPPPLASRGMGRLLLQRARHLTRRGLQPAVRVIWRLIEPEVRGALLSHVSRVDFAAWRRDLDARLAVSSLHLEAMQRTLDRLGEAVAPGAARAEVPDRIAELRERLNNVERRTRQAPGAVAGPMPGGEAAGIVPPGIVDYGGLERRFRGDPEALRRMYRDRYVHLLEGHGPVLDIGCGKGEMVEELREAGIEARGIDVDAGMVSEAVARGLDVRLEDALDALRDLPERSLGAIVAIQVIEHLPFRYITALLELVATRLRPGGIFIAETPNPGSLIVLAKNFSLDPTHLHPVHPKLMAFLAESAGFRGIDVLFFSPATDERLRPIAGDGLPDWVEQLNARIAQLNDVLFGPQDYAIVATMPPARAPAVEEPREP